MTVTWTQGPPHWRPSAGTLELSVADFLTEVPRIEPALERCQRERIGIARLRDEQADRATWLDGALKAEAAERDWATIERATTSVQDTVSVARHGYSANEGAASTAAGPHC